MLETINHINHINHFAHVGNSTLVEIQDDPNSDIIVLKNHWNIWIVILSFIVGMVGSYTTTYILYILERAKERYLRIIWLVTSCITFGGGCIWALHFTGMMALDIGINIRYNPWITTASLLVAMIGAVLSFFIKYRNIFQVVRLPDVESPEEIPLLNEDRGESHSSENPMRLFFTPDLSMVIGGFFMASAIFGMHYSGMKGMIIDNVTMKFSYPFMILSFIPAWIISIFALNGLPKILQLKRQLTFSFLSTLGVFSLHYIGMYAATYTIEKDKLPPKVPKDHGNSIPFLIVVITSVCCFVAFAIGAQHISQQRDDLVDAIRAKRYIDALKVEKDLLEKENREKTEFIAIASHEMRTPLHAIAGFTDLLSQTNLDKEQHDNLQLARQSVKVLEFVVDNVLSFTRLTNKNIEINEKWCNLSDLIFQTMVNMSSINENAVSICYLDDNVYAHSVLCDNYLVMQVVQNLISNAYKFTPSGSVVVKYHLSNGECHIQVQDTGIGISPDRLKTIFKPFSQLDKSLSRKHTGTGLGLAICRHIADLLHGDITVESVLDIGSTFTFVFPARFENAEKLYPMHIPGKFVMHLSDEIRLFKQTVVEFLKKCGFSQESSDDEIIINNKDPSSFGLIWNQDNETNQVITIVAGKDFSAQMTIKRPVNLNKVYRHLLNMFTQRKIDANSSGITMTLTKTRATIPSSSESTPNVLKIPTTPSTPSTSSTSSTPSTPSRILVAEDNKVNQQLIKKQLKKLNIECDLALNGEEAIKLIQVNGFDRYCCILMDCQMPVMDGFEATKRLRELNPDFPILALTANVTDLSRMESERAGMNAFLSKPLNITDLKESLSKFTKCNVR